MTRDHFRRIIAMICAGALLFSSFSFGEGGQEAATPTDLNPTEETETTAPSETETALPEDSESPASSEDPEAEKEEKELIPADREVTDLQLDQTLTGEIEGKAGVPYRIRLTVERDTKWAFILVIRKRKRIKRPAG